MATNQVDYFNDTEGESELARQLFSRGLQVDEARRAGAAAGAASGAELNNAFYEPPRAAAVGPTPSGYTSYGDMWNKREEASAAAEGREPGVNNAPTWMTDYMRSSPDMRQREGAEGAGGQEAPMTIEQIEAAASGQQPQQKWAWADGRQGTGFTDGQFAKGGALAPTRVDPTDGKIVVPAVAGYTPKTPQEKKAAEEKQQSVLGRALAEGFNQMYAPGGRVPTVTQVPNVDYSSPQWYRASERFQNR